ncbi:hypothetical protein KSF81_13935 [Siccirubricoccus sp. G192]|nr:hypothetical protein [Siccirubricoccus sp. G192]
MPVVVVTNPAALAAALAAGPPAAILAEMPVPPLPSGFPPREDFEPSLPHAAACGCCSGRPPAAVALDRLFQARVRGQCPWFERVVALAPTPAGRTAVEAALTCDAVTEARFRAAA